MALNASTLSAAIRAALLANADAHAVNNLALTALCDCIASSVVTHITTSAVVLPTALVAPSGGGPVTGVGTVT